MTGGSTSTKPGRGPRNTDDPELTPSQVGVVELSPSRPEAAKLPPTKPGSGPTSLSLITWRSRASSVPAWRRSAPSVSARDVAKGGAKGTAVPPWGPQLPSARLLFCHFNPTMLPSNSPCLPKTGCSPGFLRRLPSYRPFNLLSL